jgi:uncharacterized protein (DUF488 family)
MYYRRKVLLALISRCDGEIEKRKLQELLLIFCLRQKKPAYSFVPCEHGCYSFQANADLNTMESKGLIRNTDTSWALVKGSVNKEQLLTTDTIKLELVCSKFAHLPINDLIKHIYLTYPFYALHSTGANTLLNEEQKAKVAATISSEKKASLFTIGYEGRSLEEFLNILLRKNISILCDVRKNAMSMKYGFSKSILSSACQMVGISYRHMPSLGIESTERKELSTKEDYSKLFTDYRASVILKTVTEQMVILDLISSGKRVALMCFEADPAMCHRSHLADAVVLLNEKKNSLVHL